jgi:hypothetical protein
MGDGDGDLIDEIFARARELDPEAWRVPLGRRLQRRRDRTIMQATDESIFARIDPVVRAEFTTSSIPAAVYWRSRAREYSGSGAREGRSVGRREVSAQHRTGHRQRLRRPRR